MVKKLITKCLNLMFEVVGGCGLEESLWTCIVGVATLSNGLAGPDVLKGAYNVNDLAGLA